MKPPVETADHHRAIVESQSELIALSRPDGTLVYVNPAYARHFDHRPEEMVGHSLFDQVPAEEHAAVRAAFAAVLDSDQPRVSTTPTLGRDGRRSLIEWTHGVQRGVDGVLLQSVGRDITERARVEQALRELSFQAQRQSDILGMVTDAIPATVVVVDAEGRYRFVNPAFEALCGRPREQIIGRTAVEVLGEAEIARRRPYIARAMAGEPVTFVLDQHGPAGTTWLELTCVPLRLNGGAVDGFVGISQDITAQRREQARLTELAQRDPLTGLLNRAGFELCLARLSQPELAPGAALLCIDLDRFKPVNDRHGHPVGDRLLQEVAQRLCHLVRPTDAVARIGGDEFAVVLADVGALAHAEAVAAKVVAALGEAFTVDGLSLDIGASVGVALGIDPAQGWQALMRRADALLYRAKARGRGRMAS